MAAKGITMFDQAITGAAIVTMDDCGIKVRSFLDDTTWSASPRATPAWSAPEEKPGPLIR
jgi:hypothetical protein